jgi:polyisoprenoid-binding protein YceI
MKKTHFLSLAAIVISLTQCLASRPALAAQDLVLQLDPGKSGADITLAGNFHTVEGSFLSKRGAISYNPLTGKASGEVVFDATSGHTGNDSRDKKMHQDVIQSQRYPEIAFRPDRAEGRLANHGESTLQVHGMFSIHGTEHEITIPVEMNVQGNTWTAKASFSVPYARWGMKNPSKLFLRVADEVKVELHTAGTLTQ